MNVILLIVALSQSICMKIKNSNIPEDCKNFYIALTIYESGWHKNKSAVLKNNYSGFRKNNRLKTFSSEKEYVIFFEEWFKKNHIRSENDFHRHILLGKYAMLSKNQLKIYLNKILKIKTKYIKKHDNVRKSTPEN